MLWGGISGIGSQGNLGATISEGQGGAGLGGNCGVNNPTGKIYIYGGTVRAEGGYGGGAGIGSGAMSTYQNQEFLNSIEVYIYGGVVTAIGGFRGAGIGGGIYKTAGVIVIDLLTSSDRVTALGRGGGMGIGEGFDTSKADSDKTSGSHVTINNGKVDAIGSKMGTGIGVGNYGVLTINGGEIFAQGGFGNNTGGAGISAGNEGKVIVNGGKVIAEGGYAIPVNLFDTDIKRGGAGIGIGNNGMVLIRNGSVKAIGGETEKDGIISSTGIGGSGIGVDYNMNNTSDSFTANMIINGGIIQANGGDSKGFSGSPGIGCAEYNNKQYIVNVTVNGGSVQAVGGKDKSSDNYGKCIGNIENTNLILSDGVSMYVHDTAVKPVKSATTGNGNEVERSIYNSFRYMWLNTQPVFFLNPFATDEDNNINSFTVTSDDDAYNVVPDNDDEGSLVWTGDGLYAHDGWYIVKGNVKIRKRIEIRGSKGVNLLIMDGASLIAEEGIHVLDNASLMVYSGNTVGNITGSGALYAKANVPSGMAAIGGNEGEKGGNVAVYGGSVQTKGGSGATGIGGGAGSSGNGTLTLGKKVMLRSSENGSSWSVLPWKSDNGHQITERKLYMDMCAHNWIVTADGPTITATCWNPGCYLDHKVTVTICAPLHRVYEDGNSAEAILIDEEKVCENSVIVYYATDAGGNRTGNALANPPVDAGTYVAEITLGEGDGAKTAFVGYTIEKAPTVLTDDQKPKGIEGLVCNDSEQTLVTPPASPLPDGFTVYYATSESESALPEEKLYSTVLPSGISAGIYYVWYMVKGDANHYDTEPVCIPVTIVSEDAFTVIFETDGGSVIEPQRVEMGKTVTKPDDPVKAGYTFDKWLHNLVPYDFTKPVLSDLTLTALWKSDAGYVIDEGAGSIWVKNSGIFLMFHITNSADDSKTFEKTNGIEVDGVNVEEGDFNKYQGSVRIELKPTYLETLSIGEHDFRVWFDDGNVRTKFTIIESVMNPDSLPNTGDNENPLVYFVIALTALVVLGLMTKKRR